VSAWIERTAIEMADAVVAVSRETRDDVLRLFDVRPERVHVIHNGIDADEYRPTQETAALDRFGIPRDVPYALFVGRITRQKGIVHLVRAIRHLDASTHVVLCAGAPDTPEIAAEMEAAVADVYEPFGIINLEAMACETAVVASAVGGIPEVVVPGETGLLVPFEAGDDAMRPRDAERFERDLATAVGELLADPERRAEMGRAGRRRAVATFGWDRIAGQTVDLYRSLGGP
jgi:glycosyltransferase involved in cell wall biosynthesis